MPGESLTGKTALITGAGKRIGRATALALAAEGVNIVVHHNTSGAEAGEVAAQLRDAGVRAWTVRADLSRREGYETLIERALVAAGGLDMLVNSASVFTPSRPETVTFEDIVHNMELNAWAPFVLGRTFARLVGRGKIVNLLDTRITGYDWQHVAYMVSKHVLAHFTRVTALEYAPNISVNAVAPGLILPPPGEDQTYLDGLVHTVPLLRHGSAEDVAEAIIFLLRSTFLTGEVIYVDGGRHLKESAYGSRLD
jgi:pteridine reductase